MAANPEQVERTIGALRAQMEEARERVRLREEELAELEGRRSDLEGMLTIARREAVDFEARLAEQEARLEQARTEMAVLAFDEAVEGRPAADDALAEKLLEVVTGLANREERTRELLALQSEVAERGVRVELPETSPRLVDAWERLQEVVRTSLQERLEDELIDAAVASPFGREIENLPIHLQEAARRSRRESARSRGRRSRAG